MSRTLALLLAALPMAASAADAPVPASSPANVLGQMIDFTRNASLVRDAKSMVALADAVTEPSFYVAAAEAAQKPENYVDSANSMMDPAALKNVISFTDPAIMTSMMAAGMDPNFYTALMTKFADPAKAMRWMMAPMDMKTYGPAFRMMDPNLYMKWMTAGFDTKTYAPAFKAMDFNNYGKWMSVAADPKTYGVWGSFVDPKTYTDAAVKATDAVTKVVPQVSGTAK